MTDEILDVAEWEQLPTENDEAYAAFQAYISLPVSERSLLKAQQYFQRKNDITVTKTLSKQWMQWNKTYNWTRRCKAFDEHKKSEINRYVAIEQIENLVKYRQEQHALASEINTTALLLIDRARRRLEQLNPEEIAARDIPQFVKAAAMIAELASDAEARALLLQDIVEHYQENFDGRDARILDEDEEDNLITQIY